MKDKTRNPKIDYLIYIAIRLTVCVIQAMPFAVAEGFARWLGWLAYRVDKRHRNVALENLRFAFPEKSEAEIDRITRECYVHFCRVVIEIAFTSRIYHVGCWRKHTSMIRGEDTLGSLLDARPLLIVTAHFGNWELAGYALGMFGFKTYAIARVLDNPYIERFFKKFRQATGQTIIAKKDDFDRLTDVLKGGGKVATLGDQDAGTRGVFIDFMGRPASAHKAVALMAMEFDAKMIVVGTPRIGHGFNYHIQCEDVIDPREFRENPNAVKAITQRYHDALARMIRQYPEQYFWLHRRWKSQPKVRGRTLAEK